jgi:RPA family protein
MEQQHKREVAYRIFSDALKTAETVEKDEGEYAPQYTRLKTGQLVNRVLVCGALIEKEDVGTESENWKLVISDPKGTFRAYIGEYQPTALAAIGKIEVFVSVVSKIKSNEYNDKTFFRLAPEYITVIDEKTYDRWITETERLTAARVGEV